MQAVLGDLVHTVCHAVHTNAVAAVRRHAVAALQALLEHPAFIFGRARDCAAAIAALQAASASPVVSVRLAVSTALASACVCVLSLTENCVEEGDGDVDGCESASTPAVPAVQRARDGDGDGCDSASTPTVPAVQRARVAGSVDSGSVVSARTQTEGSQTPGEANGLDAAGQARERTSGAGAAELCVPVGRVLAPTAWATLRALALAAANDTDKLRAHGMRALGCLFALMPIDRVHLRPQPAADFLAALAIAQREQQRASEASTPAQTTPLPCSSSSRVAVQTAALSNAPLGYAGVASTAAAQPDSAASALQPAPSQEASQAVRSADAVADRQSGIQTGQAPGAANSSSGSPIEVDEVGLWLPWVEAAARAVQRGMADGSAKVSWNACVAAARLLSNSSSSRAPPLTARPVETTLPSPTALAARTIETTTLGETAAATPGDPTSPSIAALAAHVVEMHDVATVYGPTATTREPTSPSRAALARELVALLLRSPNCKVRMHAAAALHGVPDPSALGDLLYCDVLHGLVTCLHALRYSGEASSEPAAAANPGGAHTAGGDTAGAEVAARNARDAALRNATDPSRCDAADPLRRDTAEPPRRDAPPPPDAARLGTRQGEVRAGPAGPLAHPPASAALPLASPATVTALAFPDWKNHEALSAQLVQALLHYACHMRAADVAAALPDVRATLQLLDAQLTGHLETLSVLPRGNSLQVRSCLPTHACLICSAANRLVLLH